VALAVRCLLPLLIFRRPLTGGLLGILADASDILIFNVWGWPPWDYQQFDKLLDLYYLTIELAVAQRFAPLPQAVASGLYGWRLIGVIVFELTDIRAALIAFPNLFELWFLFVLIAQRYRPRYVLTRRRTAGWLLVLLVPKMLQEYLLHIARVLDDLVLFDVIGSWWSWP